MREEFRGEFLGFTFDGIHSSTLGITRATLGDREEKTLLPNIKDNTLELPGKDGLYFLGTQYQQSSFIINFAYDDVREKDIAALRNLFGSRKLCDLIFDEEPYKVYTVKVSGQPKLSFICFEDVSTTVPTRIYKGEGDVTVTAFDPFPHTTKKTLTDYYHTLKNGYHYDENGVCVEEWAEASRLKVSLNGYDTFSQVIGGQEVKLYNAGDLPTDFTFVFEVVSKGYVTISYHIDGTEQNKIILNTKDLVIGGHYRYNSKVQLVEGGKYISSFVPDGKIFNNAIEAGDFFRIASSKATEQYLRLSNIGVILGKDIRYDYLYI